MSQEEVGILFSALVIYLGFFYYIARSLVSKREG